MKPIRPKRLPFEIRVGSGILRKAGALLSPPGGGKRRFLYLCDLPDTDPAPSALLASLEKAGQTVVPLPEGEYPDYPNDVDALLIVGDAGTIGREIRFADDYYPGLPYVLVPTTLEAQFDFAIGDAAGLILCDPSLPVSDADKKRGLVELIRYAVGFDATLFDLLYADFDLGALLRRCLAIRCDLLDAEKTDLFDRLGTVIGLSVGYALGARDPLSDDPFDEADELAIGLAAATRYALKTGYCRKDFLSDLIGLLSYHGLPNSALISDEELIAAIEEYQWADGRNVISLPRRLGECGLVEFDPADLKGLLPN